MPERKIEYESLSQSAEPGYRLKAPSLQRLFIDSALTLVDTLVKLDRISDGARNQISVQGKNNEELMNNWLSAILKLIQEQKFLPNRIVFSQFDGKKIEAALFGENYNSIRHGHLAVPALNEKRTPEINYFDLESDKENHFLCRVYFR